MADNNAPKKDMIDKGFEDAASIFKTFMRSKFNPFFWIPTLPMLSTLTLVLGTIGAFVFGVFNLNRPTDVVREQVEGKGYELGSYLRTTITENELVIDVKHVRNKGKNRKSLGGSRTVSSLDDLNKETQPDEQIEEQRIIRISSGGFSEQEKGSE